jgi:transcriptional regulator with XRE-family HTH domain
MGHHPIAQFRLATRFVAPQLAADLPLRRTAGAIESPPRTANMSRQSRLIDDLKSRRLAHGMTTGEVAERCGTDEASLSAWERGLASPPLDAVQRWATALDLDVLLVPTGDEARRGLRVDWSRRRVAVDGAPVRLTPMEWSALERLARNPGELVTHRALFHHLYGDERHYRAESTAIRVLITKLRRLLPLRIEAQWGKGYVVSGIEPAAPVASGHDGDPAAASASTETRSACAPACAPDAATSEPGRDAAPPRRGLVELDRPDVRGIVPPPVRHSPCRAEELGVIERFLTERGVTHCPDVATIQHSPLPTLVWDKVKRKWVRPPVTGGQPH